MNNSSLLTADRATHLKIVLVSLICATVIAGMAIASRMRATGRSIGGTRSGAYLHTATKPASATRASAITAANTRQPARCRRTDRSFCAISIIAAVGSAFGGINDGIGAGAVAGGLT